MTVQAIERRCQTVELIVAHEAQRTTPRDQGRGRKAVRRPLETRISRRPDLERQRFQTFWELVLQTYSIPLGDFTAANPRLDLSRLDGVARVFDRTVAGEVVVDQIGFSALDPAFLAARVDGG